jgi:hypothetical protein
LTAKEASAETANASIVLARLLDPMSPQMRDNGIVEDI